MGCVNYNELVNEITKRTIKNLDKLNNNSSKEPVYEVTQLLNSLMGLLIIPAEKYSIGNNSNKIETLEAKLKRNCKGEYDSLLNQINLLKTKKKLRIKETDNTFDKYPITQFIRHMRNASAHSGNGMIIFYPTQAKAMKIEGLFFQDKYKKDEKSSQFCVKLTIEELDNILRCIASLYSKFEQEARNDERYDIYELENELNNFLNGN